MFALELENVSKKFIIRYDKALSFTGEILALHDVSFKLEKGRTLGFIGRNGSGKTTLLNLISGITSPTTGTVNTSGKIANLLTLGAGFQYELSGRENIYLNAALLGMSDAEIRKKFYDIVRFSELESFLDKPLQSYSLGMRMRLGFSIVAFVDFDILLIDEILSVGDISFQNKSYEKIEEFRRKGKTLVIVTHALDRIEQLCDTVLVLERGEVVGINRPHEAIMQYQRLLGTKSFTDVYSDLQKSTVEKEIRWWGKKEDWGKRIGTKEIEITDVNLCNNSRGSKDMDFKTGDNITVNVDFTVHSKEIREPHFGIAIFREDGVYCYGPNTSFDGHRIKSLKKGNGSFGITYKNLNLLPGDYRISIAIWDQKEVFPYDYICGLYKFRIEGQSKNLALIHLDNRWESKNGIFPNLSRLRTDVSNTFLKFKRFIEDRCYAKKNNGESVRIINKINQEKPGKFDGYSFFVPSFDFVDNWGKNFGTGDFFIKSVEFLDKDNLIRNFFNSQEAMKVYLELETSKDYAPKIFKNHFIWAGIFREDKVYCHGTTQRLSSGDEDIVLVYPKLALLTGKYYLSVGIWDDENILLDCHHGTFLFEIYSHKKDHGTVYIDHEWRWRFEGQKE